MNRRTSCKAMMWISLLCALPSATLAQSEERRTARRWESQDGTAGFGAPGLQLLRTGEQLPDQREVGSIAGVVVDPSGSFVEGARVRLNRESSDTTPETATGADGHFFFAKVAPGAFQLEVSAPGFAPQVFSGVLRAGESLTTPQISLVIATANTELRVTPDLKAEAQEEIKAEEKQRVLGVVPNFYVTYVPNAAPLSAKQKYQLALKETIDPVSFGIVGVIAGVQQANNDFSGYGQGAAGYGRRYGAAYGNYVIGTFIGSAILPSVLKQDPRYFYKGTGSTRSRVWYAIANSVICKGDNGRWQPDYSAIVGGLAAGGISNLYYPAKDRNGVGLTFENALIGIAGTAAGNLLQEFVFKKFTPSAKSSAPIETNPGVGQPAASR